MCNTQYYLASLENCGEFVRGVVRFAQHSDAKIELLLPVQ